MCIKILQVRVYCRIASYPLICYLPNFKMRSISIDTCHAALQAQMNYTN